MSQTITMIDRDINGKGYLKPIQIRKEPWLKAGGESFVISVLFQHTKNAQIQALATAPPTLATGEWMLECFYTFNQHYPEALTHEDVAHKFVEEVENARSQID